MQIVTQLGTIALTCGALLGLFGQLGCADYSSYRTGGSGSAVKDGDLSCRVAAPYGRTLGAAMARAAGKTEGVAVVEASVVRSCENDKWSSVTLACLAKSTAPNDMDACISALPADQQKRMEDAAVAALK